MSFFGCGPFLVGVCACNSRFRLTLTAVDGRLVWVESTTGLNLNVATNSENLVRDGCIIRAEVGSRRGGPLTGLDTMTSNGLLAPVESSAGEPEIQSPPTATEQEIGEFREQDRVLPVRACLHLGLKGWLGD